MNGLEGDVKFVGGEVLHRGARGGGFDSEVARLVEGTGTRGLERTMEHLESKSG